LTSPIVKKIARAFLNVVKSSVKQVDRTLYLSRKVNGILTMYVVIINLLHKKHFPSLNNQALSLQQLGGHVQAFQLVVQDVLDLKVLILYRLFLLSTPLQLKEKRT